MNMFQNVTNSLTISAHEQKELPALTRSDPLISDEAIWIFKFIWFGIVMQVIDLFGTVTNIINIICFVKQGLNDSINISLLGLAISDLGSVITLLFSNICLFPPFQEMDLPFDPMDTQHLTTTWLHIIFTRITSWITALITLERCLCITMPLKVKNIITTKRVAVILVCVFAIVIGSNIPKYYTNRFAMKFSLERNRTILGIVYTNDRSAVNLITYTVSNVLLPVSAFVTVVLATVVLVVKLRQKTKWRMKCAGQVKADNFSERDQRVAKMVAVISTLFIACFTPACLAFICLVCVPGFTEDGVYLNTLIVIGGLSFGLESLNSATNIFIYYHMSSKYRAVFQQLFAVECIQK